MELESFCIRPFELKDQNEARLIILSGLEERFGFLDESLNPDVDHIYEHFILPGDKFYVGILNDVMVCTGGLIKETDDIGRVVRVSVLKEMQRSGLATLMMEELEARALNKGYRKLVLETNKDWESAVAFYKRLGYEEYMQDETCIHMEKILK